MDRLHSTEDTFSKQMFFNAAVWFFFQCKAINSEIQKSLGKNRRQWKEEREM